VRLPADDRTYLVLGDRLTFTEIPARAQQRGSRATVAQSAIERHRKAYVLYGAACVGCHERYHERRADHDTRVMQEISIPAVLLLGGSSPPHEPRHQRNGAFVQRAFVVVVFVHVTLVRAPAHPLRFRRQVPIVWVAFYSQPRVNLALAPPRPIISSLELGGIGYLPPPVVAATKPARARGSPAIKLHHVRAYAKGGDGSSWHGG